MRRYGLEVVEVVQLNVAFGDAIQVVPREGPLLLALTKLSEDRFAVKPVHELKVHPELVFLEPVRKPIELRHDFTLGRRLRRGSNEAERLRSAQLQRDP